MERAWQTVLSVTTCFGGKSIKRYQPDDAVDELTDFAEHIPPHFQMSSRVMSVSATGSTASCSNASDRYGTSHPYYYNDNNNEAYNDTATTTKATALQQQVTGYTNTNTAGGTQERSTKNPGRVYREEKGKNLRGKMADYERMSSRRLLDESSSCPPASGEGIGNRKPSFPSQNRFRSKQNEQLVCTACWKPVYPRDPVVRSFGEVLHADCFVCTLCNSKMSRHPKEVQFRVPNSGQGDGSVYDDDDDNDTLIFLCAKCQEESIHTHSEMVLGTKAGERILVEDDENGDVDGVLEEIGDDLEEIMLDNIPRCALCRGDFLQYTGNIAMVGHLKYHRECFELGKPNNSATGEHNTSPDDRSLTPLQAIRYLPDRLVVKLFSAHGTTNKSKPITTIFFVWSNKAADMKQLLSMSQRGRRHQQQQPSEYVVSYSLDSNAADRHVHSTGVRLDPEAASSLSCALVGNPIGMTSTTILPGSSRRTETGVLKLQVQGTKYKLLHTLVLQIPKHDGRLLVDNAELIVKLPSSTPL